MKKILIAVIFVSAVITLGACGGNKSSSHKHKWIEKTKEEPIIEVIHHDAITHEEPVFTEKITYGTKFYAICQTCGERVSTRAVDHEGNWSLYEEGKFLVGHELKNPGHKVVEEKEENVIITSNQELTGYTTIVDQEAYDEEVQNGTKTVKYYVCETCGKERHEETSEIGTEK